MNSDKSFLKSTCRTDKMSVYDYVFIKLHKSSKFFLWMNILISLSNEGFANTPLKTVHSIFSADVIHSSLADIQVHIVNPGAIGNDQTICNGSAPAGLVDLVSPSPTNITLTYHWEKSTVSSTSGFTIIPGTNSLTYSPGILSQTTWFRRAATHTGDTVRTSAVLIVVVFAFRSNTISSNQTICTGTIPAMLNGSDALDMTVYSYKWLSSITSSTSGFAPATGTNTSQNYTPGILTQTTWYKRVVSNIACPADTTSAIAVTVSPLSVGGTVSGGGTFCQGPGYTFLTLSGYTGSIVKWQSSTSPTFASNITDITFTSSPYPATTAQFSSLYYRAIVKSGACPPETSSISPPVIVIPQTVAGQVMGGATVCAPTNSTTLTLTNYTGSILKWQSCLSLDFASGVTDISNTVNSLTVTNLSTKTYYRAVVQNATCTVLNSGKDSISIAPGTVGGILSGGNTVCSGTNSTILTLNGYTGNISNWEWSTTRDFSSNVNTIANTNNTYTATNLTATRYYRAVVVSPVCAGYPASYSVIDSVVVIPQAVGGILSGGATVCSGTNATLLTLTGYSGNIVRWESAPDNSFTTGVVMIANTTDTHTVTNLTSTLYVRVILQNNPCPVAQSAIDSVIIIPQTVGGTLAGGGAICPGNTSKLLTLTGYTGTIIKWQSSTTPNFSSGVTDILHTGNTYTVSNISAVMYYRVVVQSPGCSMLHSTTASVSPPAVSGTISGGNKYCSSTNNTTFTLTGNTGAIIRWESSTTPDFSLGVTQIANTTATLNLVNIAVTTYYRVLVSGGGLACPGVYSNTDSIVIFPASVGGAVSGNNDSVCTGINSTILTLSGFTGTIQWQSSTTSATSGFSNITGANNTTYTAINLSLKTYYRAIVTSGICTSAISAVDSIVIRQEAIGGIVSGANDTVCITTNSTVLTLSGYTGTIQWQSSTSSANAGFSNISGANNATYTATNLSVKTYYRAIVTNGICPDKISTVDSILIQLPSVGGALTSSDSVCSGTNSTLLTLNGHTGAIIRWESANNAAFTGIITQISNTTNTYTATNLSATTYYRVVVQNGNCPSTTSTVKGIVVVSPSFGGFITAPTTVCINSNSTVLSITSYSGTILRWESSTTSDFSGAITVIPHTGSSYVATNISTPTYFRAVVRNGICPQAYSQTGFINVQVQPNPGSVVGGANVCASSNSTLLTLTGYQGNIVRWESSLTSDFSGTITTIPNTTSTYGVNNITTTTYYRAVVQYLNCATVNSGVAGVIVSPLSIAGTVSGSNDSVCNNSNSTTLTLTGFTGSIQWQSSTTSATTGFSNISGANSNTYIANNLTIKTYFRVIVANGVCPSQTSSADSVWIIPNVIGGTVAGSNDTVCAGNNSTTFTLSGFTGSIQWQSSITSATSGFSNINGATAASLIVSNLTVKTYFRAIVTNGICLAQTSSVDSVLISAPPVGGTVAGSNDNVCAGNNSTTFTLSGFTGSIQWQSSTTSPTSGFSNINGANSNTYIATNLIVKTYFRAIVANGVCSATASSSDSISVHSPITNNIISSSQIICSGSSADGLLGSSPSGGNGLSYNYSWIRSTTSGTSAFSVISNAIGSRFNPLIVTQATWYRRIVSSGVCAKDTSNAVLIEVTYPVTNNIIGSAQTICSGDTSALLTGTTPLGGNGSTYSFRWLRSILSDSTGFSLAPGISNDSVYISGVLTKTTWFKRIVLSGACAADTSNAIQITVNKQLVYALAATPLSIIYGSSVTWPDSVTVKYSDSSTAIRPVVWDTSSYNPNIGIYQYTGAIIPDPTTCNSSNIKGVFVLTILPREITYRANDTTKVWGTVKSFPTNGSAVTLVNGTLVNGHHLSAAVVSSTGAPAPAQVGSYPILIDSTSLLIRDDALNDVTPNYKIYYLPGILTISNRIVNLIVRKTASDTSIQAGDSITYTINITHNGSSTLQSGEIIHVWDSAASGLILGSFVSSAGTYNPSTGTLTLLTNFTQGNTLTLTLRAFVSPDFSNDSIANYVRVKLPDDVLNFGDSTDSVYIHVIKLLDLSVNKTADKNSGIPGDTLHYTITVKNNGPGLLFKRDSILIREFLPDSFISATISSLLPAGSNYDINTGVFIPSDTVAVGESIRIVLKGIIHSGFTGDTLLNRVKISVPPHIKDTNSTNDSSWAITRNKPYTTPFDIIASDQIICKGNSASIVVSSIGISNTVYTWYADSMLTIKLKNGSQLDTLLLTSSYFYVTAKGDNKTENKPGESKKILITVHDYASDTMMTTNDTSVCYGKSVTLKAVSIGIVTNPVFTWYANPSLTLPIATGDTFPTGILTKDTLFYVTIKGSNFCESREVHIVRVTIKRDCGTPRIGLAKSLTSTSQNNDGSYNLTFLFIAANQGDEHIVNVLMEDDLKPVFPGARITVLRVFTTGNWLLNPGYNGVSDIQLLGNGNRLNIGQRDTIQLDVNVLFAEDDTSTSFKNIAQVLGTSEVSGKPINRKSQDGLTSDSTSVNDSNAIPTPIVINRTKPKPVTAIFIPDGFSPNGDDVNDYFIIENIDKYTIYFAVVNRWGNLLYENENYDNSWDGTAKKGIILNEGEGVPDGTYFCIIEYSDEKAKRIKIAKAITIAR